MIHWPGLLVFAGVFVTCTAMLSVATFTLVLWWTRKID